LATAESNRALPLYQSGPFDRLGRGQYMTEVPALGRFAIRVRRTAGTIRSAYTPSRFRNGARAPAGLLSEEDGALEARGITRHPDSSRGQHPGWFILHEESGRLERRGVTRALVSSEARHPDRFTLRTVPGIRTPIAIALDDVSLPIGLGRHASG
jgi:hypothetical protein